MKIRTPQILTLLFSFAFLLSLASVAWTTEARENDSHFTYFLPIVFMHPDILYFDDFSDSNSGWPVDDDGQVAWSYQNDQYEMLIRLEKKWAGALAPASGFTDYVVEAEMHREQGTESDCGLIFDFQDWNNYYLFVIDPGDQWYGVAKIEDGLPVVLIPLTGSTGIRVDMESNRLKVVREGNRIDVYVNDEHLDSVQDVGFGAGLQVGLYMESDTDAPASVRFDNFVVGMEGSEKQVIGSTVPLSLESSAIKSGVVENDFFSVTP